MVRLRLKRMGRKHRPFYRLNAVEKRTQRDGKIIENLGWYDPIQKDEAQQVSLKVDRIKHWLSVGAQPSETVADLLAKHDVIDAEKRKAQRQARIVRKVERMEADRQAKAAEEQAAAEANAAEEAAAASESASEESGGDEDK